VKNQQHYQTLYKMSSCYQINQSSQTSLGGVKYIDYTIRDEDQVVLTRCLTHHPWLKTYGNGTHFPEEDVRVFIKKTEKFRPQPNEQSHIPDSGWYETEDAVAEMGKVFPSRWMNPLNHHSQTLVDMWVLLVGEPLCHSTKTRVLVHLLQKEFESIVTKTNRRIYYDDEDMDDICLKAYSKRIQNVSDQLIQAQTLLCKQTIESLSNELKKRNKK